MAKQSYSLASSFVEVLLGCVLQTTNYEYILKKKFRAVRSGDQQINFYQFITNLLLDCFVLLELKSMFTESMISIGVPLIFHFINYMSFNSSVCNISKTPFKLLKPTRLMISAIKLANKYFLMNWVYLSLIMRIDIAPITRVLFVQLVI